MFGYFFVISVVSFYYFFNINDNVSFKQQLFCRIPNYN